MVDLSKFNPNAPGNPNNTIFGFPFTEQDAQLVLLPVPWEVTVTGIGGTARAADHIFKASLHVELFDPDAPDSWKKGYFMRHIDRKILTKSDYLRKEAELYIDFISRGEDVHSNQFMSRSLKDINEGSKMMNNWVFEQTKDLLSQSKQVGLIGGDHSVALGYFKALAEKYKSFGILHIDAHCDLRKAYEDFTYSHASIMYNALTEISQIERVVQIGIRDYGEEEWKYICNSDYRIIAYSDEHIKERQYDGQTWRYIVDEIINHLPHHVYISFDIDGLDPKLCPNTGMPVIGGLQTEQVTFLFKKIVESGRKLIGFDLVEVGAGEGNIDAYVGARLLWKMCNLMVKNAN